METRIEGCDSTATIQATETETDETESERESTKQHENCDITWKFWNVKGESTTLNFHYQGQAYTQG